MPTALITGATGLVGSHLAERLHREGWGVRALVRAPGSAEWLQDRGVELARGDVLDASSFAEAARGVDVVFHTAAAVLVRGGWEAYRSVNLDGTRNAIEAAAGAGARLLHLSSVAVYGPGARYREDGGRTHEDVPLSPLPQSAHYARSKRESEAMVLDAHAKGRVWASVIRPDVIYGPRDRHFVPRLARIYSTGFAPVVAGGHTTLAIVHAGNVADAALLAATSDVAGGRVYNVANDFDVTAREFIRLAALGLARRVRVVSVPLPVAALAMRLARFALRLARGGGAASLLGGSIDFLSRDNPFSSDRAKRELGWAPPVRPEVGVPESFRWWKAQSA